jgi:hypothetical protein
MKRFSAFGSLARFTALGALTVILPLGAVASAARPPAAHHSPFAVLAGAAVTCTNSTIDGDVGVWPGTAVTQSECPIDGTVHAADGAAEKAYLEFVAAYNALRDDPPACEALTGTLAGQVVSPGVYCVDATAKTGTLILDAHGDANAEWLFLVEGALTGTDFNVIMNGSHFCNVQWWVEGEAALTRSDFVGTILAGAAITMTGEGGTFSGDALAKAAVTLTNVTVTGCDEAGQTVRDKCNQGVGNGAEGCDPGNSNHRQPSNDERGGTPGNPGRKR